jgi:molybdopterin-containing oxidoreductase family membrane subunit
MAQLVENTHEPVEGRAPLILGGHDFKSLTDKVVEPLERKTPIGWWLCFIPSLAMLSVLGVAIGWLFWEGIGVWGRSTVRQRR